MPKLIKDWALPWEWACQLSRRYPTTHNMFFHFAFPWLWSESGKSSSLKSPCSYGRVRAFAKAHCVWYPLHSLDPKVVFKYTYSSEFLLFLLCLFYRRFPMFVCWWACCFSSTPSLGCSCSGPSRWTQQPPSRGTTTLGTSSSHSCSCSGKYYVASPWTRPKQ